MQRSKNKKNKTEQINDVYMCKTFIMCTELFVRGSVKHKLCEWSLPNINMHWTGKLQFDPQQWREAPLHFAQHLHQKDAIPVSSSSLDPRWNPDVKIQAQQKGTYMFSKDFFHIHKSDGF